MKKKGSLPPDWLAHHLAAILDGLTVGVIVVDASGRIAAFNRQASGGRDRGTLVTLTLNHS